MDFDEISDHRKDVKREEVKSEGSDKRLVRYAVEFRFTMDVTPAARAALGNDFQQFLETQLKEGNMFPPGVAELVEKVSVKVV